MKLFSDTISTLENAINYSNIKQKVIAQNIANVDTPNYKAKDVTFKEALNNAIEAKKTDARHLDFAGNNQTGNSTIVTKSSAVYNNSGNSVDVDKEMTELATNQIYYNALIDRISGKFTSLENVIKGGR